MTETLVKAKYRRRPWVAVMLSFVIPGLPSGVGLIGALAATLAEAFCGKLDDNLFVPISSGLVMLGIMNLQGYPGAVFFAAF